MSTPKNDFKFWMAVLSAWFADQMRNPLFATVTLFVTGGLFAFIVMASYPSGQDPATRAVPLIVADRTPYKEAPEQVGGLFVPHADSTVFDVMQGDRTPGNGTVVENLLAPEEDSFDVAAAPDNDDAVAGELSQVEPAASDDDVPSQDGLDSTGASNDQTSSPVQAVDTLPEKPAEQKMAASIVKPKPEDIHPAGSSPETIEFVRSILDKEKTQNSTGSSVQNIEPASGTPADVGGDSYLQVGSIRDRAGAPSEWAKLQKTFSVLDGLKYRIEKADLGAKGTYYRIQAGPMSKNRADDLCASIKAQKPGGCLVVR